MSLVKRRTPGRPGALFTLLPAGSTLVATLTDSPATAAGQAAGTLDELAAAQGGYVGSATDNPELPDAAHAALLGTGFGRVTPGNFMKWDATEPDPGRFEVARGDTIVDFARAHGQSVRGHTLVRHSQLPGWVAALPAGQVEGAHTPKPGADHGLGVGFSSGSLAPGASTGEMRLRLDTADWSAFDESDDYGHGTGTTYADAPKVAVYVGGELARGIEP